MKLYSSILNTLRNAQKAQKVCFIPTEEEKTKKMRDIFGGLAPQTHQNSTGLVILEAFYIFRLLLPGKNPGAPMYITCDDQSLQSQSKCVNRSASRCLENNYTVMYLYIILRPMHIETK